MIPFTSSPSPRTSPACLQPRRRVPKAMQALHEAIDERREPTWAVVMGEKLHRTWWDDDEGPDPACPPRLRPPEVRAGLRCRRPIRSATSGDTANTSPHRAPALPSQAAVSSASARHGRERHSRRPIRHSSTDSCAREGIARPAAAGVYCLVYSAQWAVCSRGWQHALSIQQSRRSACSQGARLPQLPPTRCYRRLVTDHHLYLRCNHCGQPLTDPRAANRSAGLAGVRHHATNRGNEQHGDAHR